MRMVNDSPVGDVACPNCGAAVVNVQGLSVCQHCNWWAE